MRWASAGPSFSPPRTGPRRRSSRSARPRRAANVYLLDHGDAPGPDSVREATEAMEGVDVVAYLSLDGAALVREAPAPAPAGAEIVVRRGGAELRFRPGDSVSDLRGRGWEIGGDTAALDLEVSGGQVRSESYPDALERLWGALGAPHSGDLVVSATPGYECVDWGGTSHVGGGSHGSLHRGDSLCPMLFCGCGPQSAGERDQWSLRDVAGIVAEHFGLGEEPVRADWVGPGVEALG